MNITGDTTEREKKDRKRYRKTDKQRNREKENHYSGAKEP